MSSSEIQEVLNIEMFEPRGASLELINQVQEAIYEIAAKRPLSPHVIGRLEQEILTDRVHSSAVTEGNRLSKRETLVVLSTGVIEAGTRRDEIEVRNLAESIAEFENAIRRKETLSPHFVRQVHHILMRNLEETAGNFRNEDVAISGASVRPPSFLDVPELVREVLQFYESCNDSVPILQKAAWLHWSFARIHPFRDGNGRMTRLLQDYALLTAGYPPSALQPEDREGGYYTALEAADQGGGRPLLELIAKNTLRMADRYLSIIRDEDAKVNWLTGVVKAAKEKVKQSDHRRFLLVQRAANIIKRELFELTEQLTDSIPGLTIRFRDYGSLEFDKFQSIENYGRAERTWFFGLEFRIEETVLRYIFWFGSHHSKPFDIADELPSKIVLLVSTEEEHSYYRLLDDLEEERVTLREIVPNGNVFWRRRFDPIAERSEWDTDITGGTIARDFFEEVIKKLGLI